MEVPSNRNREKSEQELRTPCLKRESSYIAMKRQLRQRLEMQRRSNMRDNIKENLIINSISRKVLEPPQLIPNAYQSTTPTLTSSGLIPRLNMKNQ